MFCQLWTLRIILTFHLCMTPLATTHHVANNNQDHESESAVITVVIHYCALPAMTSHMHTLPTSQAGTQHVLQSCVLNSQEV